MTFADDSLSLPDKPNAKSRADMGDLQAQTPWDAGQPPSESTDSWADMYDLEDPQTTGTVGAPNSTSTRGD